MENVWGMENARVCFGTVPSRGMFATSRTLGGLCALRCACLHVAHLRETPKPLAHRPLNQQHRCWPSLEALPSPMESLYPRPPAQGRFSAPTCVASEGSGRDDRLVLVHIGPISNIVLEGALGLVGGQGGGVILRVEAVVGGDALQALEGGLAAPGLRQAVAAVVALYALEGVLAAQLTWRERRAGETDLASTGCCSLPWPGEGGQANVAVPPCRISK